MSTGDSLYSVSRVTKGQEPSQRGRRGGRGPLNFTYKIFFEKSKHIQLKYLSVSINLQSKLNLLVSFFAFYTWSRMGEAFLETALSHSFQRLIHWVMGNGYCISVATGRGRQRGAVVPNPALDWILRFAQNPMRSVNT